MALRILLVDDESSVTDTLEVTLPWHELGIQEVYKANSAADALEWLEKESIDILVTDIKMPERSGIELLQEIWTRRYPIRTILLSGYAEFEYAQEALKYDVVQYLLKPVADEQLIDAIKKACDQISHMRKESQLLERADRMLRENLPVLRQTLLQQLIRGHSHPASWASKISRYEMPIAIGDAVILLLVRIDRTKAEWQDESLLYYAITNIAGDVFGDALALCHCRDDYDNIVLLLKPRRERLLQEAGFTASDKENDPAFAKLALKLQASTKSYLKVDISVVIGEEGSFPGDLPALHKACLTALHMTLLQETEVILRAKSAPNLQTIPELGALYAPPSLLQLLEEGRYEAAQEKLGAAYRELSQQPLLLKEHLIEFFFYVFHHFIHICHKYDVQFSEWIDLDYGRLFESDTFRKPEQLAAFCDRIFVLLIDQLKAKKQGSRSFLIRQIQSFIEKHLDKDVSLQAIADHVFMHPVYLSQLYKAECGEGIKEYVVRLRMEKAAHLLKTTNMKISDVARGTSFQNTSYFIKVFRRYYALSPQEFRDATR